MNRWLLDRLRLGRLALLCRFAAGVSFLPSFSRFLIRLLLTFCIF